MPEETPVCLPRRFGIEIEYNLARGARNSNVLSKLEATGLVQPQRGQLQGYRATSMTHWIVKHDGTVAGGELVSPPLHFTEESQRLQVNTAIDALIKGGGRTAEAAGIHVHVESNDLNAKQLSNLSRIFIKYEDCIYRIASSGWPGMRGGWNSYCKPFPQEMKIKLSRANTDEQLKQAYYGRNYAYAGGHGDSSRYYGLNLHSHFYRGTVEFRVFNSSLNIDRIQTYIAMCIALVQNAASRRGKSIDKPMRIGDMHAGVVKEEKAKFNFLQMLRYESGMSLEDYRNLKKFWDDSKPIRNT